MENNRVYYIAFIILGQIDLTKINIPLNYIEAYSVLSFMGYKIDNIEFIDNEIIREVFKMVPSDAFAYGIYTLEQIDALKLAAATGRYSHDNTPHSFNGAPQYLHYHIRDIKNGEIGKLHLWYGVKMNKVIGEL